MSFVSLFDAKVHLIKANINMENIKNSLKRI